MTHLTSEAKSTLSTQVAEAVVWGMQEKKAQDIVVLDMREIHNSVADYFVICSATSDTQVDAIADSVEETVEKRCQDDPWRKEGTDRLEWVIIDYVDVVAHVFRKPIRERYRLEDLWGDARISRPE